MLCSAATFINKLLRQPFRNAAKPSCLKESSTAFMSQRPALSKTEIHEVKIFKRCNVFISGPLNIYGAQRTKGCCVLQPGQRAVTNHSRVKHLNLSLSRQPVSSERRRTTWLRSFQSRLGNTRWPDLHFNICMCALCCLGAQNSKELDPKYRKETLGAVSEPTSDPGNQRKHLKLWQRWAPLFQNSSPHKRSNEKSAAISSSPDTWHISTKQIKNMWGSTHTWLKTA